MKAQIRLGRVCGIEIGLHYSWLIIALLITMSLAGHFRTHNPDWDDGLSWLIAVVTALFFFVGSVIHELSHAPVNEALDVMANEDLNQLPVVANGKLAGLISRRHILQLLQTRSEFRA